MLEVKTYVGFVTTKKQYQQKIIVFIAIRVLHIITNQHTKNQKHTTKHLIVNRNRNNNF